MAQSVDFWAGMNEIPPKRGIAKRQRCVNVEEAF